MNFNFASQLNPVELEKQARKMQQEADKELADLIANDPEFKNLKNSDDELDKLASDDSEDELEKMINADDTKPVTVKQPANVFIDYYDPKIEYLYHRCDRYFSMGILQEEINLMDKIIECKQKSNTETGVWEKKKIDIELKMTQLKNNVELGILTIEDYRNDISKQRNYELQLIEKIKKENEMSLKDENITRIENRIKILDNELSTNIEENPEEEIVEEKKIEQEPEDPYEEKSEKIFHKTERYFSIEVLNQELQLIDEIIEIKKKLKLDIDYWEFKKNNVNLEINKLKTNVELGVLDIEDYKKNIEQQKKYENELILKIEKDFSTIQYKTQIISRIKKRIELIEQEIKSSNEMEVDSDNTVKMEVEEKELITENNMDNITIMTSNSEAYQSTAKKPKKVEIDPELYQSIKERLEEYKNASQYFLKIMGNTTKAEDAMSKAGLLKKALDKMDEGEKIDEFSLPLNVSSDYICGATHQERIQQFSAVIKEFSNKKNIIMKEKEDYEKKIKQINPKEFIKRKEEVKSVMNGYLGRLETCNNLIKKLMELAKNSWVPAPLFSLSEEEVKSEVINEDVPENTLKIKFGKTDYQKDHLKACFEFNYADNKTHKETFHIKPGFNFDHEIVIKLEKSEIKRLAKKFFEVKFYKPHMIWKDTLKASFQLKLTSLENFCTLEGDFKMDLVSKRFEPKIFVSCKLHTPTTNKQYNVTSKTEMKVQKIYTPFKGEGAVKILEIEEPRNTPPVNQSQKQIPTKAQTEVKSVTNSTKSIPVSNQKKAQSENPQKSAQNKKEITYSMDDFSPEDLENPDNVNNLNSSHVLQLKVKVIEDRIKNIEGRAPRDLRNLFNSYSVKKEFLKKQIESGSLTLDDYIVMMKNQLDKDQKLQKYFLDKNEKEKAQLVAVRIPLLVKEITEGLEFISKSKKK